MPNVRLVYSIVCDDVRVEAGNKLSLMGVFENIFFTALPSVLIKFAVVNHWHGVGQYETQVRLLYPDRREFVVAQTSKFAIETLGYADNVTFFTNVAFERGGAYTVQTFIDGKSVAESTLYVHIVQSAPKTVN
jgi:hypothetical protein